MNDPSCSPDYFERLYARQTDPWDYATSAYEQAKYAATLAALPRPRFGRGLEVGCSIGVLTAGLAERCDHLVAIDVSRTALGRARAACSHHANMTFSRMRIPDRWPAGRFDLMLFSEVLYYLSREELAAAVERVRVSLQPCGAVVLVNWLGETGVARSGDQAASWFIADSLRFLRVTRQVRDERYRLDVLSR